MAFSRGRAPDINPWPMKGGENVLPGFTTQKELPIEKYRGVIIQHIRDNRVVCLKAKTGSGKSTKVPQYIVNDYKEEREHSPRIVVTQPRRLAAKTLAERVAAEMGSMVGDRVGYRIGQERVQRKHTEIIFVTIGYLIELLVHQPADFCQFTHVILDEIHERSLDSDLLSLIVKLLLRQPGSEHMKLIIMSATLEVELFSRYFKSLATAGTNVPILDIDVQPPYPVDVMYLEDILTRYRDNLPAATKNSLISTMAQFHGQSISEHEAMLKYQARENQRSQFFLGVVQRTIDDSCLQASHINRIPRGDPNIQSLLLPTVDLIRLTASSGYTVLVFLPGQGAIDTLFDMLEIYEKGDHASHTVFMWSTKIRVFALHKNVPYEYQMDCFNQPPEDICHVILATNIAESSLTIPRVNVVIDFGCEKKLTFEERNGKRLQCLKQKYCSQAAMDQRKGRTGRVCEGLCIRMMTQHRYSTLDEFEKAEMRYAPLDKLILDVKHAGKQLNLGSSPSEILRLAVQKPPQEAIAQSVRSLADAEALEANDECSNMTRLGHIAMKIPLDLRLCRVILYGLLMGCPCDAVVLAAALQCEDPFSQPTKKIIKQPGKLRESMTRSFTSRWKFDQGLYSEPIMVLNMYKTWLKESTKTTPGLKTLFCQTNAIMRKRLGALENKVAEVMEKVVQILPHGSENFRKVSDVLQHLPSQQNKSPHHNPHHNRFVHLNVDILFTTDPTMLQAILAAALCPMFVYGSAKKATIKYPHFDAKRTLKMLNASEKAPNLKNNLSQLKAGLATILQHIKHFELRLDDVLLVEVESGAENRRTGIEMSDVGQNLHLFHQNAEGRDYMTIPLLQSNDGSNNQPQLVELPSPKHVSKIEWQLMSVEGQALRNRDTFAANLEWRNPVGFVCDTDGGEHLAVAHDYNTHDGKRGHVSGVTVLPHDKHNLLAVVMILTFMPEQLRNTVKYYHVKGLGVTAVELFGYRVRLSRKEPLTTEIWRCISQVQKEVREKMTYVTEDESTVVESELPALMYRLFLMVKH